MLASASGPLGALLVIAPLAAIPVVAIVGIPQFAPVSASPADEEEIADLGDSAAAPSPVRPAKRRSADDLFAPLPATGPVARQDAGNRFPSIYEDRSAEAGSSRAGAGQRPLGNEREHEAVDAWEVDPSIARGEAPAENLNGQRPSGRPMRPGEAAAGGRGVDANGFKAGLLPAVHPVKQGMPARKSNGGLDELQAGGVSGAAGDASRVDPRQSGEFVMDDLAGGMSQMSSEQSRWQAAAARVKQLGIRKYRLEAQIEDPRFVFRCVFASAENSSVTQLFEADAETPIDAVEQVLRQVEEWLQSQENASPLLSN
jgi:hypothetical protein